jgi:hypothetical protein
MGGPRGGPRGPVMMVPQWNMQQQQQQQQQQQGMFMPQGQGGPRGPMPRGFQPQHPNQQAATQQQAAAAATRAPPAKAVSKALVIKDKDGNVISFASKNKPAAPAAKKLTSKVRKRGDAWGRG